MNTTPPPEVHVYLIRYWRMLIAGSVFAQLLLSGFLLLVGMIESVGGAQPSWTELLLAYVVWSVGTLALLCPLYLLLIYLLPVKVSAESFTCPAFFGNMVTVPWSEITGVRPFPIPGFGYLMVSCAGKRPKLWLPLCLTRFPEFVDDVGQFAGHDHVLFHALWPRVEQK